MGLTSSQHNTHFTAQIPSCVLYLHWAWSRSVVCHHVPLSLSWCDIQPWLSFLILVFVLIKIHTRCLLFLSPYKSTTDFAFPIFHFFASQLLTHRRQFLHNILFFWPRFLVFLLQPSPYNTFASLLPAFLCIFFASLTCLWAVIIISWCSWGFALAERKAGQMH